jgi:predicted PurR-regulated permease PerM
MDQTAYPQPSPAHPPALRTIANCLRVAVAASLIVLLLWVLSADLLLVFLCVLLAALFRGLAEPLTHYLRVPPMLALAIVVIALFAVVGALGWQAGPQLMQQGQGLWTQLSAAFGRLRDTYGDTPWGHLLGSVSPQNEASRIAQSAASVATTTLGGVVTAFVVLVTSLYFAINPGLYLHGVVMLSPPGYRDRLRAVLAHVGRTLQWWLLGQSVDMVLVGFLIFVGLMLLHVKLALALGVLAGLLTFVPYFGAIAAAVPALLIAAGDGWEKAAWVALLFVVAHSLEGYVVSPLVQKRTVAMPPALTILSMTVLGGLAGGLGIILAAPLAAAGLVLVRETYVEDVLHERAGRTPVEAHTGA